MRRVLGAVLALSLTAAASSALAAEPEAVLEARTTELARRLESARGPEVYAALRELWRAWDLSDPDVVEASIAAFARDPRKPAHLRAYAGLIEAYARRRRGDLDGAERRVADLGYVRDWLIVGPFENQNRTGLGERHGPELELDAPIVEGRAYPGKVRPVSHRAAPLVHRLGWIDLGSMVRPTKDVCVFATTFVKSERARTLSMRVGATGAFKLFVGADEVLVDGGYRELDAERYAVPLELEAGEFHRITAKVCGADNGAAFSLRLAELDGSPARGLTVEASEVASTLASARLRRARTRTTPSSHAARPRLAAREGVVGALQEFDRWLARSPEDPRALEAYARYLAVTGGDAEDDPKARDLAERAATREPTFSRTMLAATVALDRNGRREWLARAEALARTPRERADLVAAQAALAASGPGASDVLALHRSLARLDPEEPSATLALAEHLSEAGLSRTAEAELSRASDRRPRAPILLRARAAALRAIARDLDAKRVEARYAALRADDPAPVEQRLELAVARADRAAVLREAELLLRLQPTNAWAHDRAARALRAVGEPERATTTYARLLDNAPEDTGTLRALAEIYADRGDTTRALAALRTIVRLSPQDPTARDYLERLEPARAREDELLAWPDDRFRELAAKPAPSGVTSRVLRNLVATTVWDSGLASRFHQRVVQPLTAEAAQRARRFAVSYHSDRQVVEVRGVRVFRKDGRIDSTVTTGEAPLDDPSLQMYTLQRLFYIQLPEVSPGDVIEIKYRVDDVARESELGDYVAELEYLQEADPVAHAEYVLSTPTGRPLLARATGLPGLAESTRTEGGRTTRSFVARDLPAATLEAGGPPLAEALGLVHVTSLADWRAVGSWYWGLAKEKLEPDDEIRRLAAEVVRHAADLEAKVAAVHRFASTQIRYVALELGIEGIRPRRASLTLARGWGDCKDKAALIVAMLRSLGIEAELVLVRTGLRGRFDVATASLAPFDHAIAYVPALDRYLDGTAEDSGSNELPALDRGALGLRVSGGEGKLVTLPEVVATPALDEQDFTMSLEPDGALPFQAMSRHSGPEAPIVRRRYHAEGTRAERLRADLSQALGAIELEPGSVEVENVDRFESPLVLRARGRGTAVRDGVGWSVPIGGKSQLVANLAAMAERTTPLLLGPVRTAVVRFALELPADARVLSLPKSVTLEHPAARFELRVSTEGRKIVVTRTVELRRSRVEASEYGPWRAFCRDVDAAGAPRVLVAR